MSDDRNTASHDDDQEIAIRTYFTRSEAELIRGRLEAAGIAARVSADDAGGAYPSLSDGAHVMIRSRDRAAAEDVLDEPISGDEESA